MAFDVNGAKEAGYSDSEIIDHLAPESKFDVEGARKAGYNDNEILSHLLSGTKKTEEKPKERSWGEAITDPLLGVVSGIGSLAQLPGQLGTLAGVVEREETPTGLQGVGKGIEDWAKSYQSEALKQKQEAVHKKAEEAEKEAGGGFKGAVNAFGSVLRGTLSDPALLTTFVAEQIPNVIGSAGTGLIARGAAKGLLGVSSKAALSKIGIGGDIAANAIMQGTDVGYDTYADAFKRLVDSGKSPQEANQLALTAGRQAAIMAGGISAMTMLGVPGGTALEKSIFGGAEKGFLRGLAGETGQEFLEESGGKLVSNYALKNLFPDQDLFQGVGQAGGYGALGGLGMGAAAGVIGHGQPNAPVNQPQVPAAPPVGQGVIAPPLEQPASTMFMPGVPQPNAGAGYQPLSAAEVRLQRQQAAAEKFGLNMPEGITPATAEERQARQEAVQQEIDADRFKQQTQAPGISPAQTILRTPTTPLNPEEMRQRIDAQSQILEAAKNEPFAFDRNRASAAANVAGGTGAVRGQPNAKMFDINPMSPREARQRLAMVQHDAAAEGGNPNDFFIVPHPSMSGRFAIEQRNLNPAPYVAPPIQTPEVSPAQAQQRIEAAALQGAEQARLAEDKPRQDMISRAMRNIEERSGVASPYEAQLLQEANMGRPYNSIDNSLAPVGSVDERLTQATGIELQNRPRETITNAPQRVAAEQQAEVQARNQADIAQQERRLNELQQQQQAREQAGAERAAAQPEAPNPNDVVGAFQTPAPFRSAEQSNLINQARKMMSPVDFSTLQRAGEAPSTMSMQDKAHLNVIREGRASLKPENQVATPEMQDMVEDIRKKLIPMLRRFGLQKVGLRLVDSIENGTADGAYFKSLITIALDSDSPMGVMRHEVIHALRELGAFTDAEWKVLSNMAEKKWINQFFNQDMISRYQEIYLQDNGSLDGFPEYMQEEAIAQAFRYFTETKPPAGVVGNLIHRLNKFFETLGNFFAGKGFKSGEDAFLAERILSDIERGAITPGRAGVRSNAAPAYSLIRKAVPNETEISTQNPQGKGRIYDPIEDMLSIDEAALEENFKLNPENKTSVINAIKSYGFIPKDTPNSEAISVFKRNIINNLLYLHDKVPEATRQRSKLWYDGAFKIATDMGKQFGVSMEQVAGIMAAMSPQKDWYQNVSMAERALDILTKHGDKTWDENTLAYAQSYVNETKDRADREKRQKAFEEIKNVAEKGTPLKDMSPDDAAAFIRAYDEAFHSRDYRIVTPEGGFGGLVLKNNGDPATMMWSTYNPIKKAVLIYRNGNRKNISNQLGGEHKIRSFFNNIAAPNSDIGHVTIDTHAVAAALFEALAGTDEPVTHNFGSTGKSKLTGVGGTYGIIADAYREAAKRRGIKPREMQSITWEAVRGLFNEDIKSTIKPKIAAEWKKYKNGEQSFDQTREKAVAIAGGINEPTWKNSDRGQYVSEGGASYDKSFIPEGGVRLRQENELREKLTFNLSAVTSSIPGLKNLYELAMKGDKEAYALLQNVAESHLRHLLGGTKARLIVQPVKGVYLSDREPSISVNIAFQESESRPVMAALAKFAHSFNQQQIHVRQKTAEKSVGYEYGDGSYTTPVYTIELKRELSNAKISDLIDQSGLQAFSISKVVDKDGIAHNTLEAYYVKPNDDIDLEKDFNEFADKIKSVNELVGKTDSQIGRRVERLYVYGEGYGARLGYKSIGGNVRPKQEADTNTPRLIAEYLNKQKVESFKQKDLTKAEIKDQELLAKIFEALPVNDLKNPLVRQAYNALAKELVRQYKALPIKAEVITNETGALYRNSNKMRQDVGLRNTLKVYQTTPETFGPKGSNFSGHPLLKYSGLKDINGYPMLYNDVLRAVHDYFAHNISATEFGPKGEFAAAKNHMAVTLDPLARWALIAETRLQNAWQNFRPEVKDVAIKDRSFADQKAALPPVDFALTGNEIVDAPMQAFIDTLSPKQRLGSLPESSKLAQDFKGISVKTNNRFSLRAPTTPAFKQWFGNSKITNSDGTPKVMYHGTAQLINEFIPKQAGAIFVTENPEFAGQFSKDSESFMVNEEKDKLRKEFLKLTPDQQMSFLNKAYEIGVKNKDIDSKSAKEAIAKVTEKFNNRKYPDYYDFNNVIDFLDEKIKNSLSSNQNIMPLYIRAENPFDYENPDHVKKIANDPLFNPNVGHNEYAISTGSWRDIENPTIQKIIRDLGFDGFYVKEKGQKNLAVYNANQVKSATGNTGEFSRLNNDIRYSLKPLTKLSEPEPTTVQDITNTANAVFKAVQDAPTRTSIRGALVDKYSGWSQALRSRATYVDGKLRADQIMHSNAQGVNFITNGLQYGIPVVNNDGTLGIEHSENNLVRAAHVADKADLNPAVVASGKSGKFVVAEVARILRGEDILREDADTHAEGRRMIAEADRLDAELKNALTLQGGVYQGGKLSPEMIARIHNQISELRKQGKENLDVKRELEVTPEHIAWAKDMLAKVPEIREVLDIWKNVNTGLVNLYEKVGMIDKETADKYRANKNYVPLFKSKEDLNEDGSIGFVGLGVKRPPKMFKLKGAELERNIWENVDKQYAAMTAAAYENQTRSIAVEQLRDINPEEAVEVNAGQGNLVYRKDGKDVHVLLQDPNLLTAFQSMTYAMSPVMKFFSGTSKILRAGALLNPMFWLKQLIRDPFTASVTGGEIVTPFHAAKEFMALLANHSEEGRLLASRGVFGAIDNTLSLQQYIGNLGKERKDPTWLGKAIHKAMEIHEKSDAATRVAIFKKAKQRALKQGMSEEQAIDFAVHKARESINFSIHGASPTLNYLRHMIPFMSATINGLDILYKAMSGYGLNPEEKAKAQRVFATRAFVLFGMSLAYAMMYAGDDDYDKVPDYIKDSNYLMPVTGEDGKKTFLKIPAPYEIGFIFKTLPELFVRYMSGSSSGKEVIASFRGGLIQNLPTGGTPIPQAVKPMLEVVTNHSFFTNQPIEGISDQRLPVANRGAKASEFSKMLSGLGLDKIGLSPAKIDALSKGYFAEFGTFANEAIDALIMTSSGKEKASRNFQNMPFFKSFVTDPNVDQAVSSFYDIEHAATEVSSLFSKYKNQGDIEGLNAIVNDKGQIDQIVGAKVLGKIQKQMTKLNNIKKMIEDNQDMPPDVRRQEADGIQALINQTARSGVKIADQLGIR